MKKEIDLNEVKLTTKKILDDYEIDVDSIEERASKTTIMLLTNMQEGKSPVHNIMEHILETFSHKELAYMALCDFSSILSGSIKHDIEEMEKRDDKGSFS